MPPEGVDAIEPLLPPLQETLDVTPDTASGVGWVMVTNVCVVQPIPSLIETEYVPIERLLIVAVV